MTFSIVVPSFNQSRYLTATLDSVLGQREVTVELIVKDGGSTDGSVDLLRARSETFRWSSHRDGGQTNAINEGLREATGDILAYLNSDDVYFPGALAGVEEHFRVHPECQILYGDAYHLRSDGSVIEEYPTQEWDYSQLLRTCYLCQPAVFWRRSLMENTGAFDERLAYAMDYEYWLRVGADVPFTHLRGQFLAGSRLHEETKTLAQRIAVHREIVQIVRCYAESSDPVIHWLRHLASITAIESGFPPSPVPAQHLEHVRRFAAWMLSYAEELQIRLEGGVLTEIENLLEQAEATAR